MTDLDNIADIDNETLVDQHERFNGDIEVLEAGKKVIRDELCDRMKQQKVNGLTLKKYYVSLQKTMSFPDVSLSQAEELSCVDMRKSNKKLEALVVAGGKLPFIVTYWPKIQSKDK